MLARFTTELKRFRSLVLFARFCRELPVVWNRKRAEIDLDKQRTVDLQTRQRIINSYLTDHKIIKLQIGTGDNLLKDWLNSDREPTSGDAIFLDVLEEFPFEDQVIDYIFTEHMIEHVSYPAGLYMLRECYRVLKPNGRIRIATPDIEKIIGLYNPEKTEPQRRYLEWNSKVGIGLYSSEYSELQKRRPEWAIDSLHINKYFPDPAQDSVCFVVNNFFRSYGHQFLYDVKTLMAAMHEAGFIDVQQFSPGESNDINLRGLEAHYRLIGEEMNQFETMVLEGCRNE